MHRVLVLVLMTALSCGKEEALADADMADAEAVSDAGMDSEWVDTALPDPPRVLAPCEATSCQRLTLGGPPCMQYDTTGSFADAAFGIHAYASMVWDGADTRITLTATAGDWEPAIVLARVNGEILFDGDVGAVRPPFHVVQDSPAALTVTTVQATGIVVYVTSRAALDSNFTEPVPSDAAYTLVIDSDCQARLRCPVNGRDPGVGACGWLHYVGLRVTPRLVGDRSARLETAALGTWWALKEGHLAQLNPIVASECGGRPLGPLEACPSGPWRVGLADVEAEDADLAALELLATRLYDGAMISGILRTTANEAALNLEDATAVMESTGELRASWLLRNSAVGVTMQADRVRQQCVDDNAPICTGTLWPESRYYAETHEDVLRSIDDLQALFDQLAD